MFFTCTTVVPSCRKHKSVYNCTVKYMWMLTSSRHTAMTHHVICRRSLVQRKRACIGRTMATSRSVVNSTSVHDDSCTKKYVANMCVLQEASLYARTSLAPSDIAIMHWRSRAVSSTAVSTTARTLSKKLDPAACEVLKLSV